MCIVEFRFELLSLVIRYYCKQYLMRCNRCPEVSQLVSQFALYLLNGLEFRGQIFRVGKLVEENGWDCIWAHGVTGVKSYGDFKCQFVTLLWEFLYVHK